ncbi:unnamed protein product [Cladocopium goreaui]|uniref:Uncharacterized protein n=1 Tax=Cladocopium goreaui TaxID=2562237 RepID=A0A9P1FMN9_9DINO|nr:unnamed protein product [Cladocopium goreaui]
MVVGTRIHARFLRCALLCTVFAIYSIYSLRYGEDSRAFVGGSSTASSTGSLVVMHAYKPILRRDPILNKELQTWMRQQLRLVKRQEAGGFSNTVDRKKLYLQKLGLDKKAEELDQKQFRPPWHLKHVVAGDKFVGTFQHPDLYRGEVLDLTFEASSDTEANIFSKRGDLDDTVTLQQDYPIAFESGEQKDNDMAAYTFHKFNAKWRDFDGPMPSEDDCQYLTLPMLQKFFNQAAGVEGFPTADEFAENCADSSKGMTKEEFLAYLRAESPDYLEKSFPGIYTGRRLRFTDGKLIFDGDYQEIGDNLIYGFISFDGKPGGTFSMELTKKK